jgi:hypothetical protein
MSTQRGQRAFMARSINHPAGAARSMNDGPPFFSIASTAIAYQNLGNTGISVNASGQALANAFASSVAWGEEEPIANPALAHALSHDRSAARPENSLASIICLGVFKTTINFFFCLTLPAGFIELRTRYIENTAVSRCTFNTDKQDNSKKRLHGISPSPRLHQLAGSGDLPPPSSCQYQKSTAGQD